MTISGKISGARAVFALGLLTAGIASANASSRTILDFTVDWNNSQSLEQAQSTYCQYVDFANVRITIPGQIGRDFTIEAPSDSCADYMIQENRSGSVVTSTTIVYSGTGCFSDNDENFFVDQLGANGKPTGKEASLDA